MNRIDLIGQENIWKYKRNSLKYLSFLHNDRTSVQKRKTATQVIIVRNGYIQP
mgnify:CR=1 FL=1